LVKGYNNRRAKKVALQVPDADWIEVGLDRWVAAVPAPRVVRYARCTQTLALSWLTPKGTEKYALLTRSDQLFDQASADIVRCYDARGGMETEIREDKAGFESFVP
jgi:hypothetical protein